MPELVLSLDWLVMLVDAPELAVVLSVLAVLGDVVLVEVCAADDSVVVDDVAWLVNVDPESELAFTVPGAELSEAEVVCAVDESEDESVIDDDAVFPLFVAVEELELELSVDEAAVLPVLVAVELELSVDEAAVLPVLVAVELELSVDEVVVLPVLVAVVLELDEEVAEACLVDESLLLAVDVSDVGAAVVAVGVAVVAVGVAVVAAGAVVPVVLVDPLAVARAASISTVCMSAT
jgi:hypothetical protein